MNNVHFEKVIEMPQVDSIIEKEKSLGVRFFAEERWLSYRKNHLDEDCSISADELDSVVIPLFISMHEYGVNGCETLNFVKDALCNASKNGRNLNSAFDFIKYFAIEQLSVDIDNILNNIISRVNDGIIGRSLVVPGKVIAEIKMAALSGECPALFEEREVRAIYSCMRFNENPTYDHDIISLIKDFVINRNISVPYNNILIDVFQSDMKVPFNNQEVKEKERPLLKKGPRNPELHSYIIKIVDATLLKNPNATTYALTEKLGGHLEEYRHNHPEKKNWRISENQLRRWIKEHRELTGQDSQGKHDGNLRLEGITY
ncbi:TPA: hypothetical protein R4Z70_002991 [Klebsiella variicola subsp. variicola]|nr:hypothetical protein [Klebsiella variicola]MDU1516745.1 hypothetical protein [Klebsiella michiganensis]HBS6378869.1 hypothetical protein [Klebsiella pneumoniae]HED1922233.1 hypothetical protein [Klebsiella variicola subsp. variicola]EIY5382306.1 hypothetical protein [Klebsiella variicola]ELN8753662.1 hypothetical protein [Klebsiella variicola]